MWYTAPQLAAMFTDTEAVQQDVAAVLRIIAFFQPFFALVQIMTYALQGAGDTRYPMAATFFGIWGIRIVFGYLLAVSCSLGLSGNKLCLSSGQKAFPTLQPQTGLRTLTCMGTTQHHPSSPALFPDLWG